MNFVAFGFSTATSAVIFGAMLVNYLENEIPIIGRAFKYGKFAVEGEKTVLDKLILEVPKSYFRHFYWLAVIFFTYALYQVTNVYFFDNEVPRYLFDFLDAVAGEDRKSQVSATHIFVVFCLLTLQVYRRFYDTNFVSIYGKNSKMNVAHYILGMVHYPGAAIALLSESPKFANNTEFASNDIDFSILSNTDYIAITLFLWAWYHQHTTTVILANLRKNKKGEVVTNAHKLPFGDWFEYVSSPPQVAEIVMYASISVILVYHLTWFFVFAWVLANQLETIWLGHCWYVKTFDNFPKKRKLLIPFVC